MKIVTVGEAGSGKTSLLERFADKNFDENQKSTIGLDF